MQATIDTKPDAVKCFVEGSIKGWYNYLYGDNAGRQCPDSERQSGHDR